ncbi:hypothetical protein LRS05_05295 [Flavobacterium sp. J372]|uniref:hypothetical protein n=1 Tax=Flavobacterium sp. J372 TaxID=2898436 RepID=UPI002151C7E7|nr:hypothetical protein [Flavobacterium sp. J372]MCR5861588.1 hypothetical protein [Flavobacterium sp. J372]
MKKALLLLLLIISFAASAQVVNIPDATLKNIFLASTATSSVAKNSAGMPLKIDANNDGQIQVSESQAAYSIRIYGGYTLSIQNFTGLEAFTNLRKLELGRNYWGISITRSFNNDTSGRTVLFYHVWLKKFKSWQYINSQEGYFGWSRT